MKINEIVTERVEDATAQSNAASIEPVFLKHKKSDAQRAEGLDPDQLEIIQDLPV